MDIPNLVNTDTPKLTSPPPRTLSQISPSTKQVDKINPTYLVIMAVLGIFVSFWLSRFFPAKLDRTTDTFDGQEILSADSISGADDIDVGKVYGQTDGNFSDTATGTIEKGSINGVGTHILNRPGGASQRASLISSVVDLDMFIDRRVEIKGETNASDKTSWLLDVGSIKVLE